MDSLPLPSIPVRYTPDILVAGGGPAGFAAAVAAARSGADVLLVEAGSCFGGSGTAAGINIFCSETDGVHDLTGGVCDEFMREVCAAGFGPPGYDPDLHKTTRRFHYQVEGAKLIYDRMAKAAGFRFLFGTRLVAAGREGDRVAHVVCAAKSGLFAVRAAVFIDATGDADLAAFAGAETRTGDADGRCQAATLPSVWSGVDRAAAEAAGTSLWGQGGERLKEAIAAGEFTVPDPHLPGLIPMTSTSSGGNVGHVYGVDATDERSLTEAFVQAREGLREWERFYRGRVPGYGNATLAATGSLMGIRESRRIVADAEVTIDDYVAKRVFPDDIARACHYIDVHSPTSDAAMAEYSRERKVVSCGKGGNYGIPYRALLPRGIANLAVAGRCIGTDHLVQSSARVMPTCFATGQAAGLAAALAMKDGRNGALRAVPHSQLRDNLLALGAFLG